jgi:Major Facilitator Superfamily
MYMNLLFYIPLIFACMCRIAVMSIVHAPPYSGPMAGGYLAKTNKQYVFLSSLILTCVDLLYIYFILPESKPPRPNNNKSSPNSSNWSVLTMDYEFSWNPMDTVRVLAMDPFLRKVGEVAFLYYTGLWAVISTLSLYAVKRFHLTPERLGELISALGLCTMVAEAVLVRILVPMLGEKRAMLLGLVSFGIQCVVLGFAYEGWHLFVCAAFSMLSNLVYPSLTSLVSGSVAPDSVGEALGAVNGIKALTEGVGPLVFGSLMTLSENSALPGMLAQDHFARIVFSSMFSVLTSVLPLALFSSGSPYLLAAVLIMAAYKTALELPDVDEDDYIHELERKKRYSSARSNGTTGGVVLRAFMSEDKSTTKRPKNVDKDEQQQEEEYENLLSEIEEDDEDDIYGNKNDSDDPNSQLPLTFSSLLKGNNKTSSSSSV